MSRSCFAESNEWHLKSSSRSEDEEVHHVTVDGDTLLNSLFCLFSAMSTAPQELKRTMEVASITRSDIVLSVAGLRE